MGLRFSLYEANVIAWLTSQRRIPTGSLLNGSDGNEKNLRDLLISTLDHMDGHFLSSEGREAQFRNLLEEAIDELLRGLAPKSALEPLRQFFSNRPWTALLVPSGLDEDSDNLLCSYGFLRNIVENWPNSTGGILLQMTEPPPKRIDLSSPFPAFRSALAQHNSWPGLLIWKNDLSLFVSRGSTLVERARNLPFVIRDFLNLSKHLEYGSFPEKEKFILYETLGDTREHSSKSFHIIHLSDIHIGDEAADNKLDRLGRIISGLAKEYGGDTNVLPVISGDIVDDPTPPNFGTATNFLKSISEKFVNRPFYIPGNHDMSRKGYKSAANQFWPKYHFDPIRWFDDFKLGVVGFDTCDLSKLARGRVSTQQLDLVAEALKEKPDFSYIGVMHHHPIKVPVPDWIKHRQWWKLFDKAHGMTVDLDNGREFLNFVEAHKFKALLHGHKHIPREVESTLGVKVFGAGSATGLIDTVDRRRLSSVNIVTYSQSTREVSCRYHLEDIAGRKAASDDYVVRG